MYAAVDLWKMYVGNCRHEGCMLANKWDRVCVCLGTKVGASMREHQRGSTKVGVQVWSTKVGAPKWEHQCRGCLSLVLP